MRVLARSMTLRWAFVPVAAGYVAALALVANFAFVAEFSGAGQYARLSGAGTYGSTLTSAAPVDVQQIANDISEAGGGPPTIGQPLSAKLKPAPDAAPASATTPSSATTVTLRGTAVTVSPTTTPTYKAVTTVSNLSIASLLAMIPTNLTFPPQANAHHRKGA